MKQKSEKTLVAHTAPGLIKRDAIYRSRPGAANEK
jgi:hypothetical protein